MSNLPAQPGHNQLKKIAVFCGSSIGKNKAYAAQTILLGEEMVKRDIGLVYGGGNVGLMGVIAETVYRGMGCNDDAVIGVIPDYLEEKEVCMSTMYLYLSLVSFIKHDQSAYSRYFAGKWGNSR